MNRCRICSLYCIHFKSSINGIYFITCPRCGEYKISDVAFADFTSYIQTENDVSLLSAWVNERNGITLTSEILNNFKNNLVEPLIDEKANRLLLYLTKIYPKLNQPIPDILTRIRQYLIDLGPDVQKTPLQSTVEEASRFLCILSKCWLNSEGEVKFLLNDYLAKEKKVFESDKFPTIISPRGWLYIQTLTKNSDSKIAFVALRFSNRIMDFHDSYISKAISSAGYEYIRMNRKPHNNVIDNEMIATIRRSKFIIADYTENSFGVYYEAGYARGLGLDVISICEEKFFEDEKGKGQLHFDVNHYPVLKWDEKKGNEFLKELQYHIEATIGRGKK